MPKGAKSSIREEVRHLTDRRLALGAIILTVSWITPGNSLAQASGPSFKCANAKSVAERSICADPILVEADASISRGYAAALKLLDANARKALKADQRYFMETRDRIAKFNDGVPKERQNFDLAETMRDRVAFLKSVRPASAGFIGSWKNLEGSVEIKTAGKGKVEISGSIAKPTSGNGCDIGGTVKVAKQLKLIDADENDKPTGFIFSFRRSGDELIVSQSGVGKEGILQPPSCGAYSHFDGNFFMTVTP